MRVFYRQDNAEPMTVKDALIVCFLVLLGGWLFVKVPFLLLSF